MRRTGLSVVVVLSACLMASAASAAVTFDFNSLSTGDGASAISSYMSDVLGAKVVVTGAEVGGEGLPALRYLPFKPPPQMSAWADNGTPFIWTAAGAGRDFEIEFQDALIMGVSGLGLVYDATSGADFVIKAYNAAGSLVDVKKWWVTNDGTEVPFQLTFDEAVKRLVFSDSGKHDVAVDNLRVVASVVPEPATAVIWSLLAIGGWVTGVTVWRRRGQHGECAEPAVHPAWSDENRRAIHELVARRNSR
jgi:hypothetical protein